MSGGTAIAEPDVVVHDEDALELFERATLRLDALESPTQPCGEIRRALALARWQHFELERRGDDLVVGELPDACVETCAEDGCDRPRVPSTGKRGRPPTHCEFHIDQRSPGKILNFPIMEEIDEKNEEV